jgi:hypothetical protein
VARAFITIGLLAAAAALPGCGAPPPPPATGPAADAAAVVERLDRAIQSRHWNVICNRLYAPEVRRQAGGGGCTGLLGRVTAGLRAPRISIRSIKLGDETASVRVTTVAEGQVPVDETIELERDSEGAFRIVGLG